MKFIKEPGLPEEDVDLYLVDKKCSSENLSNVVQSYEHSNILNGISTHPDMTFCHVYDNKIVVAREAEDYYKRKLSLYGFDIIKGEADIRKEYPFDIAFNCVIINHTIYHKIEYTDKRIIKLLKEKKYNMVNVKQGYTKCSTLIVDNKSVITCDKKLNDIYNDTGLSSILVSNDKIEINGFDHGFIGGCGGKISKDTIGFFGDIEKHRDFEKIKDFLYKRNIKYKKITDGNLKDYGTLVPLLHK